MFARIFIFCLFLFSFTRTEASVVTEAIKGRGATMVAFHSDSCGTCRIQKPRLKELMSKNENNRIKSFFLDFDSEISLRKSLKISYPSTVILYKDGLEAARVTGETDPTKLQELLNKGKI